MTTTIPSAALVPAEPMFTEPEQFALAGFLASYSGLTRDAYMLDLRQFATWCHQHGLHLFAARRADIESFARDLEAKGRARSTVSRRLATIAGLYRYAVDPASGQQIWADHVPDLSSKLPSNSFVRTSPTNTHSVPAMSAACT